MPIETSVYFNQKGFNTSNFELNRGTVVSWLKAFNHYTTEFVHITFFCSFYGNDWHLTINSWRGTWMIIDPLDCFSQTSCLLIRGTCSIWLISSDKLSPYQGNLFHLIDFHREAVSLSGELVPLEWFSQTRCHHMGRFFKLNFSFDQLSVWKIKVMIDCSLYGLSIYGTR